MKTTIIALTLALGTLAQAKPPQPVGDPGWPREINRDGTRLVYYSPQVDEWRDYRDLRIRVAFSLTPKDGKGAVGVAELEGRTVTNMEARTVAVQNLKIITARFPAVSETDEAPLQAALRTTFPGKSVTVALDRIVAGVEDGKIAQKTVELKMDPPRIFTSTRDAVLLLVDGEPVRAPIEGADLEFVVNTNWNLFFDTASSAYFLLAGKTWLSTTTLDGEWKLATKLPSAFSSLPKDKSWDAVRAAVPAKVGKGMKMPRVIFSTQPAELIAFKGAPVLEKIEGTRLLWANNTESWIFQDSQDQQFYFLVSGRWFRAPELDGPWNYAGNDLPEDFKVIPLNHACADVLASVPGTPEAKDAVLLAQVPVEAVVKRADVESKANVSYGGEPKFEKIEGTSMSYATNTTSDVIRITNDYYLCQDAVWFVGAAPVGPWRVAVTVPGIIYTIPARYPVHRCTYVKIEAGNDDLTVVCSYTAGYYGAFVSSVATSPTLVYGTGWYHPPYVYRAAVPIYRSWGATYGCAAAYNPWTGGYVAGGAVYGPYGSAGRAARYNPATGGYVAGGAVHGPNGSAGRTAWYNPATGNYGRAVTAQGPYGGRTVAAGYNPHSDTGWATRQGHNGYAQWGTSAARSGDDWVRGGHIATDEGGVARWRGSEGGGKVKWTEDGARGIAYHDDSLYAGKDGNVYRRDHDGSWAKYDDGNWANVDKPKRNERSSQSSSERRNESYEKAQREGSSGGEKLQRPFERQHPSTDAPIERQPSTRPARTQPSPEVMGNLNRESTSRGRGDYQASRQQRIQRSDSAHSFGDSRSFNTGSHGGGGGGHRRR